MKIVQFLHDIAHGIFDIILEIVQIVGRIAYYSIAFTRDCMFFLMRSQYFYDNWRYIMTFTVIGLYHNFIIINEEVLVLFCFVTAVYLLYDNMSESVTESLNERAEGIRKELSTFLLIKQESLNELYKSEQSLLDTTQNLVTLQEYCQEHFVKLEQNQEKALAGLIAQNFVQKLDAVSNVSAGSAPYVHKQIATSFRETILEGHHGASKKGKSKTSSLAASVAQLKTLG